MQKIYSLFCLSLLLTPLCFLSGQTPSSQNNYIYIQEPLDYVQEISQSEETIRSVQYFDGLGRPEQSIMIQATPEEKDIVTKIEYDGFGRQVINYLPVPSEQSSGEFIDNLNGNYYYDTFGENTWYSKKEFENSPLNRVLKQAAPGDDWSMHNGKEIKFQYKTNTAQEVRLFKVNSTGSLTESGKYAADQLYKTTVIDENDNAIHEFKDKMGRVVLKRTLVAVGSPAAGKPVPGAEQSITVDTYYVYDKFGNLSFVIPPLAAENSPVTQAHLDELCYLYRYDDKNRLIEKKLPGKGWEYMVYDKQDRLVAAQDANLRKADKWLFTKYDKYGRVVYTGMVTKNKTQNDLQTEVNTFGSNNESRDDGFTINGLNVKYTKTAFPTSFNDVLTVNYYDTYPEKHEAMKTVLDQEVLHDVKGLLTETHIRIIGKSQWEKTRYVYDVKARPIYVEKLNHLGGYTLVETELDLRGKPKQTHTTHQRDDLTDPITIIELFTYDHFERLKQHEHKTDTGPFQFLARNDYDEIGQLIVKDVGGLTPENDRWQNITYKYNIRGWLTDINNVQQQLDGDGSFPPATDDDLFAMKIRYNTVKSMGISTPKELYNGNISQIVWKSGTDNIKRGYTYIYDQLNRLRSADFYKEGNPTMTAYGEYIEYDINGNIKSLYRTTGDELENEVVMDDLAYAYFTHSNRLKNVRDISGNTSGFKDGNTQPGLDDYVYDSNGNMTKDRNKGITEITYNHLNLPVKITFESGDYIDYAYNAAGEKVSKKVRAGNTQKTVEYLDGFQYAGEVLQFIFHAEGYVNVTTADNGDLYFNYVYNHTDHLGNIRVTYTKDPQTGTLEIMEENHYYPFGLKHEVYSSLTPKGFIADEEIEGGTLLVHLREDEFKYKYNGKEWQDELNLNWYDYGARNYDPALGRWMNLDPLADKYTNLSPYSYVMNNVVNAIDPDGRLIIFINGLRIWHGDSDQKWHGRSGFYKKDIFEYWQDYRGTNSYGQVAKVDKMFMKMHSDDNVLYSSGSSYWNSSAEFRMSQGEKKAKRFYRRWKKGKINLADGEAIRIVSHSQGGAHAAGFANQLKTYKDGNDESIFNIEVIYYITPHQGADIINPEGIISFQFNHPNDAIAGEGDGWISTFNGGQHYGKISNITYYFESKIFGSEGQPPCEGPTGNRCSHNVTDNRDYLFKTLNEFCKKNLRKCKIIELMPEKATGK